MGGLVDWGGPFVSVRDGPEEADAVRIGGGRLAGCWLAKSSKSGVALSEIVFKSCDHRRCFGGRCFDVDMEFVLFRFFGGKVSPYGDTSIVLLEIGEVFKQRDDAERAKEDQHVVLDVFEIGEIACDGAVHFDFGKIDTLFFEIAGHFDGAQVGAGEEKFFVFKLGKISVDVFEAAVAVEHFALTVDDKFLEVVGHGFSGTEVSHVVGHGDAGGFAEAEEVLDGVFAGKDDCGVIEWVNALAPKFAFGDAFDVDEGAPVDFDPVFFFEFEIGRAFRAWLGYQHCLDGLKGLFAVFWTASHVLYFISLGPLDSDIAQSSPQKQQRGYFEGAKV